MASRRGVGATADGPARVRWRPPQDGERLVARKVAVSSSASSAILGVVALKVLWSSLILPRFVGPELPPGEGPAMADDL